MTRFLLEDDKKKFSATDFYQKSDFRSTAYSNLNLNQNYGRLSEIPLKMERSCFLSRKESFNNYDDTFPQNKDKKTWNHVWDKRKYDGVCCDATNKEDTKDTKTNCDKLRKHSSTLDLHITACENSIEDVGNGSSNSNTATSKQQKINTNKVIGNHQKFLTKTFQKPENGFEIPRQQEDKPSGPEIMQFKAYQKLYDPRKSMDGGVNTVTTRQKSLKNKSTEVSNVNVVHSNVDRNDESIRRKKDAGSKGGGNRTTSIKNKKERKAAALKAMKKGKQEKLDKQTGVQEAAPFVEPSKTANEYCRPVFNAIKSISCSGMEAYRKEEEAKKEEENSKNERLQRAMEYENVCAKLCEANEKLKTSSLSIDGLSKTQRKLKTRLNRRTTAIARKPYSNLSTDAKADAAKRFKERMKDLYPSYTDDDIRALFKKAYAEKEEKKQMSEAETVAFQRETKLTYGGMDNARKILKECVNMDPFAPRKKVAAFRKHIREQCHLKPFVLDNGTVGAKIDNPGEAIKSRFEMQVESGKYVPKEGEKAPMCLVADGGGEHTVIGVTFGSIEKRHAPDAFLVLGILKGGESRENFDGAFGDIADLIGELKTLNINGTEIELDWFLTGDIKLLKILLGLRPGNAKNPCVVCVEPAEKSFNSMTDEIHAYRNYNKIDKSICQDHPPFLKFIKYDHIVPPGLHQFLGIVDKILKTLAFELRRLEMVVNGNDMSEILKDAEEEDDEKLQKSIKDLNEAEEAAYEWNNYYQSVVAEDVNVEGHNTTDEDGETDEGCCHAANCIVKKMGTPLPSRFGKVSETLKCTKTKKCFHTVCVGLDTKCVKNQKKRTFEGHEVSDEVILQTIKNEVAEAEEKVNALKRKLETDYCNILVPENSSKYVKIMEEIFESFGATKQAYYQTYNGVHTRRILVRATEIAARLIDPETGEQITSQKIEACCKTLEILSNIQDYSVARYLDDEEIKDLKDNICALKDHMKAELPDVSVIHKFHWLIKHVPFFVDTWKTFNFFFGTSC